jgi:transposase
MDHNFSKLIASTSNARMRIRLLAVSHFVDGKNRTEIASFLKVSRTSVNKWVTQYLNEGLEGLTEKPHTGRPALLTRVQRNQVKKYITDNAIKPQGGRLQGKDIQKYIHSEFAVLYQKTNIYHLFHELNLSWITTRSKHPKQSVEAQDAFKKIQNGNDH